MNKRVYGIVGLISKFANWNADFDKYPKRVKGKIYASDKALKYVIRRYLKENGKDVFYLKDYDKNGNVLTYEERYKKLFNLEKIDEKDKNTHIHIKNLFSFMDIKFFGTVATLENVNAGIRGIIQFTHGFNLNDNTQVIREVITSQFASGKDKKTSTIGEIILTDEAHYFYSFSLNENNILEYKEIFNNKETKEKNLFENDVNLTLTDEEYELFKKACLNAVDNYNSASKAGCNNHFALFVETEEDTYMPNLADFLKMEDKVLILDDLLEFLEKNKDGIKNIELYYRPKFLKIKDIDKIDFAKEF